MSNLKLLLKNNLNILLGQLQGKRNRKSTSVALTLLILGAVGILALYSLQSWSMFDGLGALGLGKLCVFHGITTTLTVLLIIGIMRVNGKSKTNDSDFLLSLPISKKDIIISKLVNRYLFDLFFSFVLLLPFVVMYEITALEFSWKVLFFGLIVVFLLPCLSVGISCIVDFITVRLFNRMRFGNVLKSMVPTLIYILLIVLMMAKTMGYGSVQFESMESYFQDRFFSNQILTFIFDQSLLSIIVFACLVFVPIIVGIVLYINVFGKNFGTYVNKNSNWVMKDNKNPFKRLFVKEISNYFFTPAYLINTIIGPILIFVFSIVLAATGIDGLSNLIGTTIPNRELLYIFILIINGLVGLTYISCCSISLEGKNLWILRTMPVSTTQIFLAKLCTHFVIIEPVIVVASIIFGFITNSIVFALIVFGITTLFLILVDIVELMINLWLPKLDWNDEVQVVKQGMSVLLSMVVNIVLVVIPIVMFLLFNLTLLFVAILAVIIYLVLTIVFTVLLFTKGKDIFSKLEY